MTTFEQIKNLGLQDGESVRVNHASCPAGVDYKQRLWVIRNNGGLGWHCHHCGEKGSKAVRSNRTEVLKRLRPEKKENPDSISLPYDFDSNFLHWPNEARAWVLKHGIRKPETWGWSESRGRVIIPVWEGTLKGYQARRILAADPGPKYLTRGKGLLYRAVGPDTRQMGSFAVMCEDALSAEKVGQVCDAYALLGTNKFDYEKCLTLGKKYSKVFVWFDDDSWEVQKWSRVLATRLGLITDTQILRTGRDPKNHTLQEIQDIIGITRTT